MKCLNDPKRSYKGTEPSPKGFGYCAHAQKIGDVMVGRDGNKWAIVTTKNGVKRWQKIVVKTESILNVLVASPKGSKQIKVVTKGNKKTTTRKRNGKVVAKKEEILSPGQNVFQKITEFITGSTKTSPAPKGIAPKLKRGEVKKRTESWATKKPNTKAERLVLMDKCGKKCFLVPGKLKYPICAKNKCKVDCDGLRAARNRAAMVKNLKKVNKVSKKDAENVIKRAAKLGKKSCKWQ